MGGANERVTTFVLAGGRGQRLDPLTRERPKPALPAGGVYKLIDFTLSNCFNSGLSSIHVLVQHLSADLIRHLHEGWRLYFFPTRGETLQALPPQYDRGQGRYAGTTDALHQNLRLVEEAKPAGVLVLSGDHIYRMDYRRLLDRHRAARADLTIGAVEVPFAEASHFGVLQTDDAGRVVSFHEKPEDPAPLAGGKGTCLVSMGIYAFEPRALRHALVADAEDPGSTHDLGHDLVPWMIRTHRVVAFEFVDENRKTRKYWRDVGTIEAYYQANMDLVAIHPELNLYDAAWPVRTPPLLAPPAKFVLHENGRVGAAVDSIVSPGGIVSGGRVERSVLGPDVRIHSWSLVEDSILFPGVDVGRRAKARRANVEEGAAIPEGEEIGIDPDRDRERFPVTECGIVVVSRDAVGEPVASAGSAARPR